MSKKCFICNKGRLVGKNVSHANNRTQKISQPNLHMVHAIKGGRTMRINVCTRCLRAGKVQKHLSSSPSRA